MDYQELSKNTVSKLRELVKEHLPDLKGVSGMKKEALVEALAEKLGVARPHQAGASLDKGALKAEIKKLKGARRSAIEAKDAAKMKDTREKLHRLRRQLRRATRAVV